MELGTLDFWYALREWQVLVGGRIQKIYVKDSMHVLQVYSKKLYQFVFMPGAAFFSDAKMQFPQKPGGYCMFLRKRLDGGRIRQVELVGFDRIIKLVIETKEGNLEFVIELFDDINSLVLKDGKIVSALKYRDYADRTIRGGLQYAPPPSKFAPWDTNLDALTGKPAGKAIAVELGLGGRWSDEIIALTKLDKKNPLDEQSIKELHSTIAKLKDHSLKPQHTDTDAIPFHFKTKSGEYKESETFNAAINSVVSPQLQSEETIAASAQHVERQNKQQKIITAQKAQLEQLEKQIVDNQRCGELIYEHYAALQDLLSAIKADWKVKTYKEIRERYANHPLIKAIHPDGTIEVEL